MVVASLSVTSERSAVIDFVPYYTESGGVLIREKDPDMLQVAIAPIGKRGTRDSYLGHFCNVGLSSWCCLARMILTRSRQTCLGFLEEKK